MNDITPQHRQRLKELFYHALELEFSQRAEFILQVCAGDELMRDELESLLQANDRADVEYFLESSSGGLSGERMQQGVESKLRTGQLVGQFKIVRLLGEGGMGEVYLARDQKLDRYVALKFVSTGLLASEDYLRRMILREARAASILSHPNICTVHEVAETENGRPYLVLEYIKGKTLEERLSRGRMKLREVLHIVIQLASALEAAHQHGVVHRDLKPGNIMLRPDGLVKVLDLGLAKLDRESSIAIGARSHLSGALKTGPGVVMGTVTYMSPEQVRCLPADARTDIWSLGVVFYLMVTGRHPFDGLTPLDVAAAILLQELPPLSKYPRPVRKELESIINKSLVKDREERYQTVAEMLADLHNLRARLETKTRLKRRPPHSLSDGLVKGQAGGRGLGKLISKVVVHPGKVTDRRANEKAVQEVRQVRVHRKILLLGALCLLIAATVVYLYSYSVRQDKIASHSIAIMPFVNVNADPEMEYLSDGLTESLINDLSRISNLRVIARNSVFRYKAGDIEPEKIGRDLKVQVLLTGRMVQRGDTITISVELTDVRNNRQIWGEMYNQRQSDLLTLQRELSQEIFENLQSNLVGVEQKHPAKDYTHNAEAYRLYLMGRYFLNKRSSDGFKKAAEYFQKAIEEDPRYALAYAGLSDAYQMIGRWDDGPLEESFQKARDAAVEALALDEQLAEAHVAMAGVKMYNDWDWAGTRVEYERAIELNPHNADAHSGHALYCSFLGQHEKALSEMNMVQQLDPFSTVTSSRMASVLFFARQYDRVIEYCREGLELQDVISLHLYLGWAYEQKGMYREAIAEFEKYHKIAGDPGTLDVLGHAYTQAGKKNKARNLLKEMFRQAENKKVIIDPIAFATIYLGLGEKDQALEWLNRAYQYKSPDLIMLKVHPYFDDYRSDPRFIDLLRHVKFIS